MESLKEKYEHVGGQAPGRAARAQRADEEVRLFGVASKRAHGHDLIAGV